MKKKCVLMRGCPGSGKSTRAKERARRSRELGLSVVIVSADDYFVDADGRYEFDGRRLNEAHKQCFDGFVDGLFHGFDVVILDNTNIKFSEFELYLKVASLAGRDIIIDGRAPKDDAEVLEWHRRNVHGVPFDKVQSRARQWEDIPPEWENLVTVEVKHE